MIIDADTHISPLDEALSCRAETLVAEMDASGVDKAIVWLQPPYMRELDESLEYIRDSARKYPDRLLPFGWANPHLGLKKSIDTIKKCVDYGFHGVKLNGAQESYYIDDDKMSFPLIEEIAKAGVMLCFHVGADAYEFTHPYRVGKVAERWPELPILLAHMGGCGSPDLSSACVEMAEKYKNLTLIGSQISFRAILSAINKLGPSRVCCGSDMPYESMRARVAGTKALLERAMSKEDADLILGGNVARLFKL